MLTNAEKIQEWHNTHPDERITVEILRGVLNLDTLRGADLQNADLWGANLRRADLWDADLQDADLRRADLQGANLWDADLQDANLRRANLRRANLRGANLWDADLRRADLWDANLQGANLWDADLQDADLRHADLRGANLWDADLQDADLRRADLWDANLRGADLRRANLQNNTSGSILQIFGLYPYPAILTPTPVGWQLRVGCWTGTVAGLRDLAAQDDGWPEASGEEILRRRPLLYAIADMCDTHIANHAGLIEQLAEKWENRK